MALWRLPARPPRRRGRGRLVRRGLLHVQRGDRLVLPVPPGGVAGVLLPGRRGRARWRRLARRQPVRRERTRASPVSRQAPRCTRGGARPAAAASRGETAAAALSRRAPPELPRGCAVARLRQRRLAASLTVRRLPPVLLAVPALAIARLLPADGIGLGLRLGAAIACLLIPGVLISRALRLRGFAPALAWSLAALLLALAITFAVHSSLWLPLAIMGAVAVAALPFALRDVSGDRVHGHRSGPGRIDLAKWGVVAAGIGF